MNLLSVIRSLLIYLLLCYGKKFVDSNPPESKTQKVSQPVTGRNTSGTHERRTGPQHDVNARINRVSSGRQADTGRRRPEGEPTAIAEWPPPGRGERTKSQSRTPAVPKRNLDRPAGKYDASRRAAEAGRFERQRPRLLELDIEQKQSGSKIRYSRDEAGGLDIYIARRPYYFESVFKGHRLLWKSKDGRYPFKVTLGTSEHGKPKVKVFYSEVSEEPLEPDTRRQVEESSSESERRRQRASRSSRRGGREEPGEAQIVGVEDYLIQLDLADSHDSDKYQHRREYDKALDTFIASRHYLFSSIVKGEKLLWQARGGRYARQVVVRDIEDRKPKISVFYPKRQALPGPPETYAPPARSKRVPQERGPISEEEKPKVETRESEPKCYIDLDIDGKSSTKEYRYTRAKGVETYTARKHCVFNSVYRGHKVIWEAKGNSYPVRVILTVNERGKPLVQVLYPEEPEVEPEERAGSPKVSTEPEEETLPVPAPTELPTELPRVADEDTAEVEAPIQTIALDVKCKHSTPGFKYENDDEIGIYFVADGFAFNQVRKSDALLWSSSMPTDYAYKVMVNGIGHLRAMTNVTIYQFNGQVKHFNVQGRKWVPGSNLLELDIDRKRGGYGFSYDTNEITYAETFSSEDYLFNVVKSGAKKIWETDLPSESSYKVVLTTSDSYNYLTIFKLDGTVKLYSKSGADWEESIPEYKRGSNIVKGKKYYLDIIMTFAGLEDNQEDKYDLWWYGFVLKYDIYSANCTRVRYKDKTVWTYDPRTHGYSFPREIYYDHFLVVQFEPSVQCYRIEYDDDVVYRYDAARIDAYPTKVYLHHHMKFLLVYYENNVIHHYRLHNGKWVPDCSPVREGHSVKNFTIEIPVSQDAGSKHYGKFYNRTNIGNIAGYSFIRNPEYVEFRHGGMKLFEYRNTPNNSNLKEVYFMPDLVKIVVRLEDVAFYIYDDR